MSVEATSVLSGPVAHLAFLVASSPDFQARTRLPNESAALAHIHEYAVKCDGPRKAIRPFAWIDLVQGSVKRGGYSGGTLRVSFEADTEEAYRENDQDATRDFMNWVGNIMAHVQRESEAPGRVFIPSDGVTIERGPQRSDNIDVDDYFQIALLVRWGLNSSP